MSEDGDDLRPEERALLAAWQVEPAPLALAEGALARRRRPRAVGLGVAVVLVGLGVVAARLVLVPAVRQGVHPASGQRQTLHIGDRAVAVAEAGSELSWSEQRDGVATVRQASGNVFYRVEPGGPFRVETEAGEVRVAGTCFRVEVEAVKTMSAGLLGGAAGAALATAVVVTVYEGKVSGHSEAGQVEVVAGQSVRMGPGQSPQQRPAALISGPGEGPSFGEAHRALEAGATLPPGLSAERLYQEHRKLAKEAQDLRAEVQALRQKHGDDDDAPRGKFYAPDPEELKRMAEHCELRWDQVPVSPKPELLNDKDAKALNLSAEEREIIDRAIRAEHARVLKELTALYVEVTGDPNTGSLSAKAMFNELEDKAPEGEMQRVFQILARERAGLPPAQPASGAPPSAFERVFRLMTSSGDTLEAAVAKELGPETAHAYRDLNGGFGSRHRSSYGCPNGQGAE